MLGCAAQPPEIVTEYETIVLTRTVFVPVRDSMVEPVDEDVIYVPDGDVDTITMRTTLGSCQTQVRHCNGKLAKIDSIEGTVVPQAEE